VPEVVVLLEGQTTRERKRKRSNKVLRIKYLVTSIQFPDCNSTTMLFNHSQFGLGVGDWIFHPLVVKKKENQCRKKKKVKKKVKSNS